MAEQVHKSIQDYKAIYDGDRYCVMCRHVCPVERMTKREATSPHGWALLIASVERGLVEWDADTVDTLYQCADCGLCQANCATNRPLPATIVAARASVVEQGAQPTSVARLDERLREWGNPYGQAPAGETGGQFETALFAGAAYQGSEEAVSTAHRLLGAAGIKFGLISAGRSGAYLPYTTGLWETARVMAQQTLDEIERAGVREVITLSKEDAHAFAHVYPEIGVPLPSGVRVTEFTTWLWGAIEQGRLDAPKRDLGRVVYHDPCHTPRLGETAVAARKIVEAVTGAAPGEMFWRERDAAPCGAIGGFEFTQPRLAEMLALARIAEAREAGADTMVTDDPQCAAHLARFAGGLPVVSLVELFGGNG